MLLSKKGSYISGLLRLHSRQRHPTTSTATSRTSKSRRRRRRGRTSGVTVRLSMPIFLLMTSKVLSIFLLAPCAAAPCASSACSSIHKHHFLPGHTLKVRCVLVQSERVEPYRDLVQSKSSSFFAQPLFPAVGDDPTALTNFGPTGPRVQHRHQFATSGPPWSADHLPPDDLERLEHFPPHTQHSNALRLERLFIHKHHFLLGHILKVRRELVQSERAKPRRYVQYCRVEIFFVFLRTAAISCRG